MNQIWSDEEIGQLQEKVATQITEGIGLNLLNDHSAAALTMLEFLRGLNRHMGEDDATAGELGRLWLACCDLLKQNPTSELAQTFKAINDAWEPEAPQQGEAPSPTA